MPECIESSAAGRLAYHHMPGTEPGILFCPGFNSDMQGNKALALEAWSRREGVQFTRFDYFGHGESDGAVENGTIGQWRDDALTILDAVTVGSQIIVGSSMGGWIMLLVALARPKRIAGLVGVASAPDFTRTLLQRRLDAQQQSELQQTGFCELSSAYGEPYRIGRELLSEAESHLLLEREITIDVPVRLIHGQCDEDVPWETSMTIASQLSSTDVELQLVKSGDHRLSEEADLQRLLNTVAVLRESVIRGLDADSH